MSVRCFEVVPVIEKLVEGKSKTQVSAVECFGDKLYVGTTDGFLVYYELDQGVSATGKLTCSTTLKAQQHTGSSKPVAKIMLAPDEKKLLVLSDTKILTLDAATLLEVEGSKAAKGHGLVCRDVTPEGEACGYFSVTRRKGIFHLGFGGKGSSSGGTRVAQRFPSVCTAMHEQMPHLHKLRPGRLEMLTLRMHMLMTSSLWFEGLLGPDQRVRDNEGGQFTDVVAMARDGRTVCFAQKRMYKVVNLMTQEVTELFPYDDQHTIPMVTRVASREFLLNVWTEGVTTGMFVSSTGNISRAPIQWPFGPTAVAVNYPYILALNAEQGMVTVHSILDQQSKQVLVYPNGKLLNDTSQRIFIATRNTISLIAKISFETQIEELLETGRVAEALTLAGVRYSPDGALDAVELNKRQTSMQRIQRRAGVAYLKNGQFPDGLDLLAATDTDPREVIALYPGMLPASSTYKPNLVPAADGFTSMATVAKTAADVLSAKKALVNFLNVIRSDNVHPEWRPDIDTVLAKLYAELDGAMLLELLSTEAGAANNVLVDDVAETLAQNNRHHALALLYWQSPGPPGSNISGSAAAAQSPLRKALEIWRNLTSGKVVDRAYPGLEFAIQTLSSISDPDLVYMHAEWMLNADQSASRVFTQRTNKTEPAGLLKPGEVMTFLRPYGQASMDYLEYLVFDVLDENEPYHTRLALLYLERVKAAAANGDEMEVVTARSKLKVMLQTSSHYKVELLLAEVQKTDMLHNECAVLFGKLGHHEQALKLLVNRLQDYHGAEQYCVETTEGFGREDRQNVFLTLLRVYLVRGSGNSQQAINLLNSPQTDLDPSQVLQLVPPEWGIGVLHAFLRRSVRQKMHLQRTAAITSGLAKMEHLQARAELVRLKGWGTVVHEDTPCEGAACLGRKTGTCSCFEGGGAVCINTETRQVAHKRCVKDEHRSHFPKQKPPTSFLTYE